LIVRGAGQARSLHAPGWGFPRPGVEPPTPVNLVADLRNPMWSDMVVDPRYRVIIPVTAFAEPAGERGRMTRTWFSVKGETIFGWAGFARNTDSWGPVFVGMTSTSNDAVMPLNNRMPTLLYPHEYEDWLTCDIAKVIAYQFRRYPDALLEIRPTDELWVRRKARPEEPSLF
jgi:putative SOS response-associated peptidase YedK